MEDKKPDKFWIGEKNGNNKDNIKKLENSKKVKNVPVKKDKINFDAEKARNGLAQLVLTVVELLRELMEKQAIKKMDAGYLSNEQIENLGITFKRLKDEVVNLRKFFDLKEEDLNFDLGPIKIRDDNSFVGKASAIEILDKLLNKGVLVKGDIIISVAEVDLVSLNLGLLLASIDKAKELYAVPSSKMIQEDLNRLREENKRLKDAQNKIKKEG